MESSAKKVSGDVEPFTGKGLCRVVVRDGETEYLVMPRGAGVDLADEVGAHVEMDGLVREDADGVRWIQVRSFRILDEFEDEQW